MKMVDKYTDEVDSIIYSTITSRGDNTVDSAGLEARKAVFAATKIKLTLPMVKGRYYKIRNDRRLDPQSHTTSNMDARQFLVDMLMSRENVTLEIQGKQITAVFK